jgi:molybdopterin converting factor small subunit
VPVVRLPSLLQPIAGGATSVEVQGATLGAVIDDLDRQHPGLAARIIDAGEIRPEIMLAIDADETRDLTAPVPESAEVHILPAIAGGV